MTEATEAIDPSVLVARALDALQSGHHALAVGFALMVLTFLAGRTALVSSLVPREYIATTLLGLSALGGFGAALASGTPPLQAGLTCLLCSASAIAFWEGFAKHVVKALRRRE